MIENIKMKKNNAYRKVIVNRFKKKTETRHMVRQLLLKIK